MFVLSSISGFIADSPSLDPSLSFTLFLSLHFLSLSLPLPLPLCLLLLLCLCSLYLLLSLSPSSLCKSVSVNLTSKHIWIKTTSNLFVGPNAVQSWKHILTKYPEHLYVTQMRQWSGAVRTVFFRGAVPSINGGSGGWGVRTWGEATISWQQSALFRRGLRVARVKLMKMESGVCDGTSGGVTCRIRGGYVWWPPRLRWVCIRRLERARGGEGFWSKGLRATYAVGQRVRSYMWRCHEDVWHTSTPRCWHVSCQRPIWHVYQGVWHMSTLYIKACDLFQLPTSYLTCVPHMEAYQDVWQISNRI